ncbi:hypothetical protein Scep_026507 [Stephania cephalantha]|uniref:Uncharacterized protein n=1 Tax=Stephania cephalantha TaxID=152367 RepID=A0AAP0HN84_9MAGN
MVEVNAKNLNNLTAMDQSSCDEGYFIIGWLLLRAIEQCAKSQETIEVTISHDQMERANSVTWNNVKYINKMDSHRGFLHVSKFTIKSKDTRELRIRRQLKLNKFKLQGRGYVGDLNKISPSLKAGCGVIWKRGYVGDINKKVQAFRHGVEQYEGNIKKISRSFKAGCGFILKRGYVGSFNKIRASFKAGCEDTCFNKKVQGSFNKKVQALRQDFKRIRRQLKIKKSKLQGRQYVGSIKKISPSFKAGCGLILKRGGNKLKLNKYKLQGRGYVGSFNKKVKALRQGVE